MILSNTRRIRPLRHLTLLSVFYHFCVLTVLGFAPTAAPSAFEMLVDETPEPEDEGTVSTSGGGTPNANGKIGVGPAVAAGVGAFAVVASVVFVGRRRHQRMNRAEAAAQGGDDGTATMQGPEIQDDERV